MISHFCCFSVNLVWNKCWIWNHSLLSYVYITIIFVILLSRYYYGSIHRKCMRAYRQNRIHCWRGVNDRMWDDAWELRRWCARWEGECVRAVPLRLRGRDAKFRCSSLQRLIEYRWLLGNISYHHAHITHVHTRTHLTSRSVMVVVYTICEPSSSEMGVLLLLDNEGQVVRGVAEHLMALLGEGDPGALLPTPSSPLRRTRALLVSTCVCPSAGGVSVSHASSRPLKCPPVTRGARELRPRSMAWARHCFRDAGWGGAGGSQEGV